MRLEVIFPGAFVVVGLGLAVYGCTIVYRGSRSSSWPATNGQITSSQIISDISGSEGGTTYRPDIRFAYQVAGTHYEGSRIFFGDSISTGSGTHAKKYIQRYPVGRQVPVYYDAESPQSAVLEPGASRKSYILLAFGLFFAGAGVGFRLLFWLFDE